MKPTVAIFRIPDNELGEFVEVPISKDGIIAGNGTPFSVLPGDDYNELKDSQIVFAIKPTPESSRVLKSFTMFDNENVHECKVTDMKFDDLVAMVQYLYDTEFVEH